jgi:PQQ-dependent catabolism-associated CXXCW motif protein
MSGAQLYDQLGEALKTQCARFGANALDNRRRVVSLLADALPEARREIRAVASALDEGAVEALTSVERRLLGMEMDRQADRLEQSVGLRPDLAKQVIRALAYALDLGPQPSVYEAAAPSTSTPAGARDWAGMSQPVMQQFASHPAPIVPPSGSAPIAPPAPLPATGLNTVLLTVQGRAITAMHAALAACAVAVVVFGLPMLTGQRGGQTNRADTALAAEYAGESIDTGVQPKETLESNVGSPTPTSVPGGQRVTTVQVRDAVNSDPSVLLIDVLVDPHQRTIQGARYVPAAGQPGSFSDTAQTQTAQALQTLTGGNRDRALIFFCAGSACWESYNAVLRARSAGYTRLFWYRGGLASWSAAGLPMQPLPQPGN